MSSHVGHNVPFDIGFLAMELAMVGCQAEPRGIIDYLDLRRPIYLETARHGHFGRHLETFTWERTNKAKALRKAAGL